MKAIPLMSKKGLVGFSSIDDQDFDLVSLYSWRLRAGYAVTSIRNPETGKQQTISMHRLILGYFVGDKRQIDHKDRNRLNNLRDNLRDATAALNCQNRLFKSKTSSYRGVYWAEDRKKWRASGRLNYKLINIGTYDSEEEAAEAAHLWRVKHMPYYEGDMKYGI